MRPYQVFAGLSPERVADLLEGLKEKAPLVYTQAIAVAGGAIKARPRFILKQSPEKRAGLVRNALARVIASDLAEEVLAAYFLEVKKGLLVEWLDALGLDHEDGMLKEDAPGSPGEKKLESALKSFLKDDDRPDRELLLRAFAAQRAIEWPELEATFESA